MVNYENSIIYKIYGKNHDMVYYGSTTRELRRRKYEHIKRSNDSKGYISKKIINTNDFIFEIVEKYPCNNKKELHERERYYIENFKCINILHPLRNYKEYYQDNKDEINKKTKIYYQKNKDFYKKYRKEYYENNKDEINKNKKIYDKERYQKIKNIYICECGSQITITNKNKITRHEKSKKHVSFMNNKI